MEELLRKKIGLLTEQTTAYEQLVEIQKSEITALENKLILSEKIIEQQKKYIDICKTIEGLNEKKQLLVAAFIEEIRKN